MLAPLRENALEGHPWGEWAEWAAAAEAAGQRLPGATSRWNRGKDLSWEPLRAERVAEVAYDHLQGDRFRHGTTFVRWRDDKQPADCRYDQLEETPAYEIAKIFGTPRRTGRSTRARACHELRRRPLSRAGAGRSNQIDVAAGAHRKTGLAAVRVDDLAVDER